MFDFRSWFVVESPRWLALRGKRDKAKKVLRHIAKINNVSEDECTLALKEHFQVNYIFCCWQHS